jgi:hypothetical protein
MEESPSSVREKHARAASDAAKDISKEVPYGKRR